jgi:hypothetical protein
MGQVAVLDAGGVVAGDEQLRPELAEADVDEVQADGGGAHDARLDECHAHTMDRRPDR